MANIPVNESAIKALSLADLIVLENYLKNKVNQLRSMHADGTLMTYWTDTLEICSAELSRRIMAVFPKPTAATDTITP